MHPSKVPASASAPLVGLVLLLTVAGVVLSLMPLVKCPSCRGHQRGFILKDGTTIETAAIVDGDGTNFFYQGSDGTRQQFAVADITAAWPCDRCGLRKRVSVFNRLRR